MKIHKNLVSKSLTAIILIFTILYISMISIVNSSATSQLSTQAEYANKIFDKDSIIKINIDIEQSDWNWLIENAIEKEYRSCTVTINGETFYNVGIKPKGNSTLTSIAFNEETNRFSFKLDFGEYMEGQTCFGLQKISLNNMFTDKTYMKEYLSYELFEYMDVACPATAYANISINNENWGLYLAVENIEESFIERQFNTIEGNLYKPETLGMGGDEDIMPKFMNGEQNNGQLPNPEVKNNPNDKDEVNKQVDSNNQQNRKGFPGSSEDNKGTDLKYDGDSSSNYSGIKDNAIFKRTTDNDFKNVINMIKNLNNGTNLEKYLDVNQILRYFAVNTFLVNLDSYAGGMYHNYYLYEKDGYFKIIPWDFNMSFAAMKIDDEIKAINFPIDNPVTVPLEDAPLIGKLLEVPEYKELYHNYLKEIATMYINNGVYEASIAKTFTLIDSYVKNDNTAFYEYEDFKNSIPTLTTFGKDRAKSVIAQLYGQQPSTEYGTILTTIDLSLLGKMENGDKKGGPMPPMDGMPDMKNMDEVMTIMKESNGKELTLEQKKELEALGVDEAMIDKIKNMPITNDEPINSNENSITQITIIILSFVILIAGLLYVLKFKRKKFRAM